MKKRETTLAVLAVLIVLAMQSCMNKHYLRTEKALPAEIAGTYTLLLHGNRYGNDVENVAVLDKEGDRYSFEILAPPYDYSIQSGLSAEEALKKAGEHVRSHHAFLDPWLSRIFDREGNIAGYEMRPLYRPLEFGYSDILYVDYRIRDSKIIVWIRKRHDVRDRDDIHDRGPGVFTD